MSLLAWGKLNHDVDQLMDVKSLQRQEAEASIVYESYVRVGE